MTLAEAAVQLGLRQRRLREAIHARRLIAYSFSSGRPRYQVTQADLEAYLAASRVGPAPRRPGRRRPRLEAAAAMAERVKRKRPKK